MEFKEFNYVTNYKLQILDSFRLSFSCEPEFYTDSEQLQPKPV